METKSNLKKRPVSARVTSQTYDELKAICEEFNKTMSDVIEAFVEAKLKNYREWKKQKSQVPEV